MRFFRRSACCCRFNFSRSCASRFRFLASALVAGGASFALAAFLFVLAAFFASFFFPFPFDASAPSFPFSVRFFSGLTFFLFFSFSSSSELEESEEEEEEEEEVELESELEPEGLMSGFGAFNQSGISSPTNMPFCGAEFH